MGYVDQFDFTGRRVCVTGAASGIGAGMARAFAGVGATVVLADVDREGLAAMARELGGRAEAHHFDQGDIASIERLVQAAGILDVLLNNAGILLYEPFLDLTWADLRRIVDVDLVGPIALTRLVGEQMVNRKTGVIIHTSSQLVFNGAEFRAVYSAAKAAISQLVKTAALEWGRSRSSSTMPVTLPSTGAVPSTSPRPDVTSDIDPRSISTPASPPTPSSSARARAGPTRRPRRSSAP